MIIPLLTGIVIIVLAWLFFFRGKGSVLDPNLVLVTVFDNQTGSASLDAQGRVAADNLAEGIAQMEGLAVVPVSAEPGGSQEADRIGGNIQSIDQLKKLADQTGAGIVITGSYYLTGQDLQFTAKITDSQTGKLISSVSSDFGAMEKSDKGFSPYVDIIRNLRQRVMGVLAARNDSFMSEVLSLRPPTYDAYQEYRTGWEYFGRDNDQSIQHFQRAYELDPSFIWALHMVCMIHSNRNDFEAALAVADRIDRMRESLTEFDRYVLDYRYAYLQRNIQKGLSVLHQAEKKFPESGWVLDTIGLAALYINRPQEALESLSKIDMEKGSKMTVAVSSWSISRMITAYHMLGDFEKEKETIQRAIKLFPDRIWRTREVRVSAALGRMEDVQRYVEESLQGLSKAGNPGSILYEAVEELRVRGYMEEAQNIADRLVDWTQKQMPGDPTESQLRSLADRLYLAQRWDEAHEICKKLAENYPDSFAYAAKLGCIAAREGNPEEARRVSEDLGTLNRPYLFGRHTYRRARIASLLGEKQRAVDLLQQAMREGYRFTIDVIQDQDFLPLKDFPPFQEFLKPKG